jgi:hypothetical protein
VREEFREPRREIQANRKRIMICGKKSKRCRGKVQIPLKKTIGIFKAVDDI